jgi:hypothetical protein
MSFIRQLIERKISGALGASVTMGDFRFSPMSGTIEALALKVAAERFATPFLTIDRLEAKVVVTRALKGEIVVRNMTIERPSFVYAIRGDGSTNMAKKVRATNEAIVPKEGAAGGTWEFDAEKILVVRGRAEFRDARKDNYTLSIEGIDATLAPEGNDLALTLLAESVGRRDRISELGALKLLGKLVGGGFRNFTSSALTSRASLGDAIVIETTSTLIVNRIFDVVIAGSMKLATIASLLPLSPAQNWAIQGNGEADVRAAITLHLPKSIQVKSFELKADGFAIGRTFGARVGVENAA